MKIKLRNGVQLAGPGGIAEGGDIIIVSDSLGASLIALKKAERVDIETTTAEPIAEQGTPPPAQIRPRKKR